MNISNDKVPNGGSSVATPANPPAWTIIKLIAASLIQRLILLTFTVVALCLHFLWYCASVFRRCVSCRWWNPRVDWTDTSDFPASPSDSIKSYRVCVIGAGFSGIGTSIKLLQEGMKDGDFVVLERAHAIGGTWRDNQYPNCACDVPATLYSFSFEPNPDWQYHYARQQEIRAYLERCVNKYGIRPFVRFGYRLSQAVWDEGRQQWKVTAEKSAYYTDGKEVMLEDGSPQTLTLYANFLFHCGGGLADPQVPKIPGMSSFRGSIFHSARWNHDYDLTGKRVAVVGSGASAVQIVPGIQPKVAHMVLFQRTPSWVVPRLDFKFSAFRKFLFRHVPLVQKLVRAIIYYNNEALILYFRYQSIIMSFLPFLVKGSLEMQVRDPELRRKLTPTFKVGCKRMLVSSDWFPAITSPNVTNVFSALRQIKSQSVVAADGSEYEVDAIIFATGFLVQPHDKDPKALPIFGKDGVSLLQSFGTFDSHYLGITFRNFPNLFLTMGPSTGLGHNSIVFMIECQVNYAMQLINYLHLHHKRQAEPKKEVIREFNEWVQRDLKNTIWNAGGCRSWYLDKDGQNRLLFPTFTFIYRFLTENLRPDDYHIA